MAFTNTQKARIKQRAQELVAQGTAPGPAAQQALRELIELDPQFSAAIGGPVPFSISEAFPTAERAREREEQARQIRQRDIEIEDEQERMRLIRSRELRQLDPTLSASAADSIAQQEIQETFTQPAPFGYGTPEERAEGGLVRAAEAILPSERQVEEVVPAPEPEPEIGPGKPGMSVDWSLLEETFVDELGIPREEVAADVDSFKRNFYLPALQSQLDAGVEGREAIESALDSSFQEFADISYRLKGEAPEGAANPEDYEFISDAAAQQPGPDDPWVRTFSRQVSGDGIPNLTERQRAYLNEREDRALEREVDRIMETRPTTSLQSGDFRLLTRDEVRQQVEDDMQTWWLQEDAQDRIENPDLYTKEGWLVDETGLGTQIETTAGWLLRSALAPFNIVPGLVAEIAAPGEEFDIPDRILTNIAENRGFMGESQAIMEERGITYQTDPTKYVIGSAVGFALDVLDPSPDFLKAGIVGSSAAIRYNQAIKNIYGEGAPFLNIARDPDRLSQSQVFRANAIESFQDDYILAPLTYRYLGSPEDRGSFRSVASARLTEDVDLAIRANLQARANPNFTVGDFVNKTPLSDAARNTSYYRNLVSKGENIPLRQAIDEAKTTIKAADNVLVRSQDIADDLIEIGLGRRARNYNQAQINRIARATSEADPVFANALRDADGDLARIIRTPSELTKFIRVFAADEAMSSVFKSTKDLPSTIKNIVALTDNTYAGREAARKILDRVSGDPTVRQFNDLKPEDIFLAVDANEQVVPFYKLDPADDVPLIRQTVDELDRLGTITRRRANIIRNDLAQNRLSTKQVRFIIDRITDTIAEAQVLTDPRQTILRSSDISRLTPRRQLEILEPFERRTLVTRELRNLFANLRGNKPIELLAGPAQRNMLKAAAREGQAALNRLTRSIKDLTKNIEVQKAYGIIDENATKLMPITPQEALSYLIAGPSFKSQIRIVDESSRRWQNIRETLEYTLQSAFQTNKTIENIFDNIAGTTVKRDTSVFTDSLRKEIRSLINNATRDISVKPSLFFVRLDELIDEVESLMRSNPRLFRGNVNDIKVLRTNGKIPTDLQIAAYIKSEAGRITDNLFQDFAEKSLTDFVGTELAGRSLLQKALEAAGIRPDNFNALPRNKQLEMSLKVKEFIRDIIVRNLKGETYSLPQSPFARQLVKTGEDIARHIMRINNFSSVPSTIDELEQLTTQLFRTREGEASLKALYGNDITTQLTKQFEQGFEKLRESLIDNLRTEYLGTRTEKGVRFVKTLIDGVQNLRYLALLNLRPRFHGVNLLTGAEIFYSNLGIRPRIQDIMRGAQILMNPFRINKVADTAVAVTTPTGKRYTVREMLDLLQDATGKTVYRPELYNPTELQRARNTLEKGPAALDLRDPVGSLRQTYRNLQDLPQSEDQIFRYAALALGLREGRSEAEAIEMARKSMFDRADITDLERRTIGSASLFYNWARNAFVNGLRNVLFSVKGLKRIKNISRAQNFVQDLFLPPGSEEREIADFAPSYANARIITGVKPIIPEEGRYEAMAAPALPSIQNFDLFSKLIRLQVGQVIAGFVAPEYKALLNIQDPFAREYNEVPAEHLAILDAMPGEGGDAIEGTLSTIMWMFGGSPRRIAPVPVTREDGTIYISYPFITASQKRAYANFMKWASITGLQVGASDIARALPSGDFFNVKGAGPQIGQDVLGFTPMTTFTPEKQAFFDRLGRQRALREATRELREAEQQRIDTIMPRSEVQEEQIETRERIGEEAEDVRERMRTRQTSALERRNELMREYMNPNTSAERRRQLKEEMDRITETMR